LEPGAISSITFVCVVGAALMQLIVVSAANLPPAPVVGASGAVFGLLLAYGMAYPRRELIIFPDSGADSWRGSLSRSTVRWNSISA
jgi:membrane associated rhomboid family serine protease